MLNPTQVGRMCDCLHVVLYTYLYRYNNNKFFIFWSLSDLHLVTTLPSYLIIKRKIYNTTVVLNLV